MRALAFASLIVLAACPSKKKDDQPYTPAADVPAAIKTAVTAPDRSAADRALDAGRKPGEVMAFFQIAPGQKIGELFAAGGYTTEVLARIAGDGGHVWAQ